jgi:regulator of sigma E protease
MSVVLFLVILAILIFVHELGHFIFAKLFNIRVDEFAIGFPPKIFGIRYGETLYTINLIPFGGFVKIFGENPDEKINESHDEARSFIGKPRFLQALTLIAGVFFNIIFAWLLISGSLVYGLPEPLDYGGTSPLTNQSVLVVGVLPQSPGEKAGLRDGDRILSVEALGKTALSSSSEMIRSFIEENQNETLRFLIGRNGKHITIETEANAGIIDGRKAVGIALEDIGVLKLSFSNALGEGLKMTSSATVSTAEGLFSFIKNALFGHANLSQVTGPIGIANLVGEASDFGFSYLLNFIAFISINLAVINLLPFPALDGGRLFIVIIESLTRRPLNYKYVNAVNAIGFVLLIILMILVSYKDVTRLLGS